MSHFPTRPLQLLVAIALSQVAWAQPPATIKLDLGAQSLASSLNQLASHAGLTLLLDAQLVRGRQAPALRGEFAPQEALRRLLAGSGLQEEITRDGTVVIKARPQAKPSAEPRAAAQLGTITVTATRRVASDNEAALDKAELRLARGVGNADIFSAQPQIQVNNIRNEGGAMDVGIRNLQGEGRVPVVIDGSLQATHTGRGYMGTSDRTYIDADLISAAKVNIGSSHGAFSSGAVGGLVQIQTLEPQDVLKDGEDGGVLLKGSLHNNNKTPDIPADAKAQSYYVLKNQMDEDHFHNGALTLAAAKRLQQADLLLAYSKRRTGNYFAGRRGYEAFAEGKQSWQQPPVSHGQEVVNTSYDSDSLLAKVRLRPSSEQQLQLSYRKHQQEAGEVLSAYWYASDNDQQFKPLPPGSKVMPQWALGSADVQSLSSHYTLSSADNPLLNLSVGLWGSDARLRQRNGLVSAVANPKDGDQYLHHFSNQRHGFHVMNSAELPGLPLTLNLGLASNQEKLRPDSKPGRLGSYGARNANRDEQSVFANISWQQPHYALNAGINLHRANIDDHASGQRLEFKPRRDLSARLSVRLSRWQELQLSATHAYRNPSLHEGSTSSEMYSYSRDYPLRAEQLRSYEAGTTLRFDGLLRASDQFTLKAKYFDNKVKDYLTQALLDSDNWLLGFTNYDQFRNRGGELALDYQHPLFFVDANLTHYRKPKVCSAAQAQAANSNPWRKGPPIDACNAMGFAWSLTPSRIQPQRKYVLTTGVKLLEQQLKLGSRIRYHSAKKNPRDWLAGTGASAIVDIPATRLVDVFAEYQLGKDTLATLNISNLRNRYAIDPGSLVTMPVPGRTIRLGFESKF